MPDRSVSAWIVSSPSAASRSFGAIGWFGPVPTHDCAARACPAFWRSVMRLEKAAGQRASGGSAAQQTAEPAGQETRRGRPAFRRSSSAGRAATRSSTEPAHNVAEAAASSAAAHRGLRTAEDPTAFERLVGEHPEHRHGDRRHAALPGPRLLLRLALSARTGQNSIDHVEKSHICLRFVVPPRSLRSSGLSAETSLRAEFQSGALSGRKSSPGIAPGCRSVLRPRRRYSQRRGPPGPMPGSRTSCG